MGAQRLQELFGLDGRTAVVTGGSRGIGAMIAAGLLDAGAEVIISARKVEPLVDAADELSSRGPCTAVPADLSTDHGVGHLADAVAERFGDRLDILVNNAGATWGAPVDDYPVDGWDKVMGINVRGPFFLTQALLPMLRAAATPERPSRVINVGSVNGITPPESDAFAYSSSKAAVHMLTRHLAKELAGDHVTVNAIAPGPFDSKMMAFVLDDPDTRAALASGVPLGRIGADDDMAGVAIYLASAAASYVTGVVVPVAGGLSTVAK